MENKKNKKKRILSSRKEHRTSKQMFQLEIFQNGTNERGEARWRTEHSQNIVKEPLALKELMCSNP